MLQTSLFNCVKVTIG